MAMQVQARRGSTTFAEIEEFGNFSAKSQRYICKALDIARGEPDPRARWARTELEAAEISAQRQVYSAITSIRSSLAGEGEGTKYHSFFLPLMGMAQFDICVSPMRSFAEFRFLYERLLGGRARPSLLSAFSAAMMLPHVAYTRRALLIPSMSAAAMQSWGRVEPLFFPEWIER
jgi:hypothetical protein